MWVECATHRGYADEGKKRNSREEKKIPKKRKDEIIFVKSLRAFEAEFNLFPAAV